MAPGERIFSTLPQNDFGFMTGTSAAAAQVAAVLAMTSAQFPDVEMKTQVHTLIRSASPLASQVNDRLLSFDAPAYVQGLMAEFGWIARY
jgi:subtilisin family serine protease